MAPIATQEVQDTPIVVKSLDHKEPLKYSGSLNGHKQKDITPVIGTEIADIDLAAVLQAPNADELIRDLAIKSM